MFWLSCQGLVCHPEHGLIALKVHKGHVRVRFGGGGGGGGGCLGFRPLEGDSCGWDFGHRFHRFRKQQPQRNPNTVEVKAASTWLFVMHLGSSWMIWAQVADPGSRDTGWRRKSSFLKHDTWLPASVCKLPAIASHICNYEFAKSVHVNVPDGLMTPYPLVPQPCASQRAATHPFLQARWPSAERGGRRKKKFRIHGRVFLGL